MTLSTVRIECSKEFTVEVDLGGAEEFSNFTQSDDGGKILFTFQVGNLISTNAKIIITAQETEDRAKKVRKIIRFKIVSENEKSTVTETSENKSPESGFDGV